jgi:hypothetical protein
VLVNVERVDCQQYLAFRKRISVGHSKFPACRNFAHIKTTGIGRYAAKSALPPTSAPLQVNDLPSCVAFSCDTVATAMPPITHKKNKLLPIIIVFYRVSLVFSIRTWFEEKPFAKQRYR